jgi:hypothetical protein
MVWFGFSSRLAYPRIFPTPSQIRTTAKKRGSLSNIMLYTLLLKINAKFEKLQALDTNEHLIEIGKQ